jgi:hypothetical protein
MDDRERNEILQELLHQPPSEKGWQQIWAVFAHWPDGPGKNVALQDTLTRLETWDDELRHMTSQSIPLYRQNQVAPIGRLVRSISFHRREEGTGDLMRIADSPNAGELRWLTLYRCDIGAQGVTALARSQHLNNLTHLRLVDTYLPLDTVSELLRPSGLPRLSSLELIECGIKDAELAVLPQSSLPAQLTHLSLADNLIGDEAAHILAELTTFQQLKTLDLSKNGISAAGRQRLQDAPHLAGTELRF